MVTTPLTCILTCCMLYGGSCQGSLPCHLAEKLAVASAEMHFAGTQPGLRDGHLFSLFLMLPLAYVTLALLLFNWYPSQVSLLACDLMSCLGTRAMS